jgi:hypothetical protein
MHARRVGDGLPSKQLLRGFVRIHVTSKRTTFKPTSRTNRLPKYVMGCAQFARVRLQLVRGDVGGGGSGGGGGGRGTHNHGNSHSNTTAVPTRQQQ